MLITINFTADLTTGTLAQTEFYGSFSYDIAGTTGIGTEYISLTALAFTLDGVDFTKTDLNQGGQVITQDGYPSYFTGAFTPPPKSPITDIAFGFGGPGIIGYSTPGVFGAGTYQLVPTLRSYLVLLFRRLLRLFSK
jgi:hypothetical protein